MQIARILTAVAAAGLLLSSVPPSEAADGLTDVVVSAPAGHDERDHPDEVETDWRMFVEAGFSMIRWQTWGVDRERILENLLGPDYEGRTGVAYPKDAFFDYAIGDLTGGDFNDVIVASRLPGDCGPNGCTIIVFSMRSGEWRPVARFNAMAVAHRFNGGGIPEIAAIGDDVSPSTTLRWNGSSFVDPNADTLEADKGRQTER